jgi:hypothetical protein
LNLQIARAYLTAADPAMSTRSWQSVMQQMARNMTLSDTGFLGGCRYLLHDRDAKFCVAFDGSLGRSASKQ